MARLIAVVSLLLATVFISSAAAAGSEFDKDNLIRSVTNRVESLENSILHVVGRTRDALHFTRFAQRYGRRYETAAEITHRFKIFRESLDQIRSTNRKGLSYKLGINRFADMSWEEFRATRLGAAQNCSATLKGNHRMTAEALPETKDWREAGIVSPVKDQGHCGSCWTFSTSALLLLQASTTVAQEEVRTLYFYCKPYRSSTRRSTNTLSSTKILYLHQLK